MADFHSLSEISEQWEKLKIQIEELHRQRKKEGLNETVKKGIELYIQFLFWTNDKTVNCKEPLSFSELEIKPVNVKERLDFIQDRPDLFPSYIQLCELMIEQEKLLAKKHIIKKSPRQ